MGLQRFTLQARSKRLCGGLLLLLASTAGAQNILNNSDHISPDAISTIAFLAGTDIVDAVGGVFVDQTCASGTTGSHACSNSSGEIFVSPAEFTKDAINTQNAYFPAGSDNPPSGNHAPYAVLNQSSGGYDSALDQTEYSLLEGVGDAGVMYVWAFCGTRSSPSVSPSYPPVVFSTVLPNKASIGTGFCQPAQGIEFSIPVDAPSFTTCVTNGGASSCPWTPCPGVPQGRSCNGHKGPSMSPYALDVSSPSATTEALTGVMAILKFNHPEWTWGDVKSALRETASCWKSGYDVSCGSGAAIGFGYGNVNYVAANSVRAIYLQPPGFVLRSPPAGRITSSISSFITLYPFATSRRAGEVVYAFTQSPTFPSPSSTNEYTFAQIAKLTSSFGGSLIYNSAGARGVQTPQLTYTALATGTVYFVAFTVDNRSNLRAAHFSRAEPFSVKRAYFYLPNPNASPEVR
jgi:hypothetical protein